MEQAQKTARELIDEQKEQTGPDLSHMDNLKPDINNLLHKYLPGQITIEEVEILAMVINDIIWNPEKYLNPKPEKP